MLPASWSWPSILRILSSCPEYRQPSSNSRRRSAGLSTRVSSSTSRLIVVSTRESRTYRRQRVSSPMSGAAPGYPPKKDVLVEGDPEGGPHLRERPVRDADDLEPAGKALGQALLHEEGRSILAGPRAALARRGCPRPTGARPTGPTAGRLLDVVDDEQGARRAGLEACRLPLGRDPLRGHGARARRQLHETNRDLQALDRLGDERRLAHLPWPRDHLDEPPGLAEAPGQLGRLPTAVCDRLAELLIYESASCSGPWGVQAEGTDQATQRIGPVVVRAEADGGAIEGPRHMSVADILQYDLTKNGTMDHTMFVQMKTTTDIYRSPASSCPRNGRGREE